MSYKSNVTSNCQQTSLCISLPQPNHHARNSDLISSILGKGCITIILSFALVITLGVSTKQPLTCKHTCVRTNNPTQPIISLYHTLPGMETFLFVS